MLENRLHNSKLSSIKKRDSVLATSDARTYLPVMQVVVLLFSNIIIVSLKERIPEIVYIPNTVATSKT